MHDNARVITAKQALRTEMKARRAAIPAAARQAASQAIAAHGLEFVLHHAKPGSIVGGFMPIGEEISPLPLMAKLHAVQFRLALPVMIGKMKPLEFRAYAPGDALVTAVWGIREPGPNAAVVEPDVVLTALLAFEDSGYRLGYGGGYYDRTLNKLRRVKTPLTIGLGFEEQRVDAVPRLDYDERLDWILTPSGVRQARA